MVLIVGEFSGLFSSFRSKVDVASRLSGQTNNQLRKLSVQTAKSRVGMPEGSLQQQAPFLFTMLYVPLH